MNDLINRINRVNKALNQDIKAESDVTEEGNGAVYQFNGLKTREKKKTV